MAAIHALLGEYNKVIEEMLQVLKGIREEELVEIKDKITKDADCKSIQTILTHVVYSGRRYTHYFAISVGDQHVHPVRIERNNVKEYSEDLVSMFEECSLFFHSHPEIEMLQTDPEKKITVSWGQIFDGEQLMEHAIVHIMRHRRQIEAFLK